MPTVKVTPTVTHIGGELWRTSVAHHGEDGEEEGGRLPRASLGTRHQVSLGHDDGQGILLDWRGPLVLGRLQGSMGRVGVGSTATNHAITSESCLSSSVNHTELDKQDTICHSVHTYNVNQSRVNGGTQGRQLISKKKAKLP